MKTRDPSPPLHVHVSETTPVHVHLKRSQKSCPAKASQVTVKEVGNLRATARVKARAPWIPPGTVSTRREAYKWEGPSYCLEITSGSLADPSRSPLQLADLSVDDEDEQEAMQGHRSKYGRKIDSLMMDVGSPMNEEDRLVEATKDLDMRERENNSLRHPLMKIGETCHKPELESLQSETDMLLRKLVEAEIDGMAVATQLTSLRETMGSVKKDKRLSKTDTTLLGRQQELLVKKIETFDSTNRVLRELLREFHERETESLRMSEQRRDLLQRLANTETEKMRLLAKLNNKEKEAIKLAVHLDSEKDNVKTTEELSKVLESTRSHLQTQLRSKEAESDRQVAQIQRMEQTLEQQQMETHALLEQLQELKHQSEEDKHNLRQRTQTLKQRAEQGEDSIRHLSTQLLQKDSQLAEAVTTAEDWCARHSKEMTAKSQIEMEITFLNNQVTELTAQLHSVEGKARAEREGLLDQLHHRTSDNTTNKLENQRLKAALIAGEEKLTQSQSDVKQFKITVKQHESQMDKYKSKVQKARLESEDYCLKLEMAERAARDIKVTLEREIELVRRQLLGRLRELEPLPEMLKRSELQLREAQEQAHAQERRNTEQNGALSELRNKAEQHGSRVETFQEKNLLLQEENKHLKHKTETIERKLEEANSKNRDMVQVIGKRENTIHSTQQQLEERARECSILSKQLEQALEDTQILVDQSRDRALSKERSSQSKALELESQLGLTRTEMGQLRRGKEDMERRFQSQLKNMKDRLEQSDCTNRSLQNYVQFLKSSYSNVFGDSGSAQARLTHLFD